MTPGRYNLVFDNREICGGFTITTDGTILQVWGGMTSHLLNGSSIDEQGVRFELYRINNGYYRLQLSNVED